jgi:enamine deaminase RidA (YjgF/YER057c/UK114 family)
MTVEERLKNLGITLPTPGRPIAAYVPAVRTGSLVFVSGQLSRVEGKILHPGRLGDDVSLEQGQEAARIAAISALAVLKSEIGALDRVRRIVRLSGYVACTPEFADLSKVIDGASTLVQEAFGDAGQHSRVAVGVAALPLHAPVEIDLVAEIDEA